MTALPDLTPEVRDEIASLCGGVRDSSPWLWKFGPIRIHEAHWLLRPEHAAAHLEARKEGKE